MHLSSMITMILMLFTLGKGVSVYGGNGGSGFGGVIGPGSLTLTDDGITVSGSIVTPNPISSTDGTLRNALVFYFETSSSPSFSDTSSFTDIGDDLRKATSGTSIVGTETSVITFPTGFTATHAIALSGLDINYCSIYRLQAGGTHTFVGPCGVSLNASPYLFSFNLADLGLTPMSGVVIRFVSTYLNAYNSFRSNELFGLQTFGSNVGQNPVTLTDILLYATAPPVMAIVASE